jgi:hypothetical protein
MIRYALSCPEGHSFDSWFQSAAAFDGLQGAGQLTCPVCGSAKVAKSVMAPAVAPSGGADLSQPANEREAALARLRRHVEENSEYVGMEFVSEARRIHEGDAPERSIHGEARPDEARRLIEEGVPVAPLPFMPQRKVN